MIQYRPLFDMKFNVAQRIASHLRLRNLLRAQSKLLDCASHRNSVRIASLQEGVVQSAHQCATADERSAEAYSFLLGKAKHLDGKWQSASLQFFQQSDGQDDSENAIVGPSIRNCVEVRTDQESRSARLFCGVHSAQVPGRIDS